MCIERGLSLLGQPLREGFADDIHSTGREVGELGNIGIQRGQLGMVESDL
jgi:hypothetical protein